MHVHRRDFLGACAAGAAGLALGPISALPAAEGTDPPIIDTHQHLWDLSKLSLPWVKSSPILNRSFLLSDYLQATAGLGVVKAIYMEVAVEASQKAAEADYIIGLCSQPNCLTRAAVIGAQVASEGFRDYIRRYKGNQYIKGVREILRTAPGQKQVQISEALVAGVRLLGELGMSFDLCLPVKDLAQGAKLVDQCPGTRFILDHCGNADPKAFRRPGSPATEAATHDPDQWRRDIAALANRKNIVCKISGIISRADRDHWTGDDLAPIVNHCLESFGPDRVMFAGDWPVCMRVATLRQWITVLRQIVAPRSAVDRKKLFHDNAAQFYGV